MEEQHAFRGEILRALSQVYPVQSNGQIILAVVWICHMVYFLFGVRTIKKRRYRKTISVCHAITAGTCGA